MTTSLAPLDPLMAALDQVSLIQQEEAAASPDPRGSLIRRVQDISTALGNPISAQVAEQAVARTQVEGSLVPVSAVRWNRPMTPAQWQEEQAAAEAAEDHHATEASRKRDRAVGYRIAGTMGGAIGIGLDLSWMLIQGLSWGNGAILLGLLGLMGSAFVHADRLTAQAKNHVALRKAAKARQYELGDAGIVSLETAKGWAQLPHALPELYAILTSGVPFLAGDAKRFEDGLAEARAAKRNAETNARRNDTYSAIQAFVEGQLQPVSP